MAAVACRVLVYLFVQFDQSFFDVSLELLSFVHVLLFHTMAAFFLQAEKISLVVVESRFQRGSFPFLIGVQFEVLLIEHFLNGLLVALVEKIEFSSLLVLQSLQLSREFVARTVAGQVRAIETDLLLERLVLTRLSVVRLLVLTFDVRLFHLNDGDRNNSGRNTRVYLDVLGKLLLTQRMPFDQVLLAAIVVLVEIHQFRLMLFRCEFISHSRNERCEHRDASRTA